MPSEAAIRPRQVRFEWSATPLHWVPDDPMTSDLIDVLHLLLPAGERWFVNVYRQVLPAIGDERLRGEVRGFMGQEAVHSRAHAAVLDHLREHGLETSAYTRRVEWMFERLLGDRRLPAPLRRRSLRQRRAPGWELLRAVPRYLRPSHHPVFEATPERALEYLASSPAARAARG